MQPTPLDDHALPAAVGILANHASVEAAYLLGSAVAGRLRPDSDLDIAVLPRRPHELPPQACFELAAELGAIFGRTVDLGVLTTGNVVYAKEAVAHGRLFFHRDRGVTARFAMLVLSMYAELQESRREVLRAYAA